MLSVFQRPRPLVDLSLYLVTDKAYASPSETFYYKVLRSVEGGVRCVQLRESDEKMCLQTAISLKKWMDGKGIPLIINNHVDVALAVQAGLHLGQRDLPYLEARRQLGPQAIIGLTVNSWQDLEVAQNFDVDYLGLQVFASKHTKPEENRIWGLEGLRQARAFSDHRIVAIGGIGANNLSTVYAQLHPHTDGVAMVRALWQNNDPYADAFQYRQLITRIQRGN